MALKKGRSMPVISHDTKKLRSASKTGSEMKLSSLSPSGVLPLNTTSILATTIEEKRHVSLLDEFIQSMHNVYEEANKREVNEEKLEIRYHTPDMGELIENEAAFFFEQYVKAKEPVRILGTYDGDKENKSALTELAIPSFSTAATLEGPSVEFHETKATSKSSAMSWRDWLHQEVFMDVYPNTCKTPQDFFQVYLERRQPPTFKASSLRMFGMALCNVIVGPFSGWNVAIAQVGYGHFWLGNLLASIMYFVLADCLSELSSALPVLGGSFAYSRALMGNLAGFIVGNSENLMYCMCVTLLNCTVSDAFKLMFPESAPFAPLVWLLFSVPSTYLVTKRNKLCWRIVEFGSQFCLLIIGLFVLYGMTMFHVGYLEIGWPEAVEPSKEQPTDHVDHMFLTGLIGPFIALPTTAWWFLGLEAASLFSKESEKSKYVPRSLYWSWFTLTCCMVLLSIFGVLTPPGTGVISAAFFPMPQVLESTIAPSFPNVFTWVVIPSIFLSMIGNTMSATRQTYALSRSGYLPALLSITSKDRIPARAAIFAATYSVLCCFLVEYLHQLHGEIPMLQALISIIVISGAVSYVGIGMCYIVFRFKYPKAARPYKSYTGLVGAVLLILISFTIIFVQAGVNVVFQLTCAAYAAKMSISGAYFFFYGRLHLKPTEESLIASFWDKTMQ
jgi:ethanolamine permease